MIDFGPGTQKGQLSKNGIVCIHSRMDFFLLFISLLKDISFRESLLSFLLQKIRDHKLSPRKL